MLVELSPTPTSEALHAQQRVGWQPSRFLTDRAEAERAFQLAERLGSVNATAAELGTTWPSLRKPSGGTGSECWPPPEAVRQRAIASARQRTGWTATPSPDPGPARLAFRPTREIIRRPPSPEPVARVGGQVHVELIVTRYLNLHGDKWPVARHQPSRRPDQLRSAAGPPTLRASPVPGASPGGRLYEPR
jgi:hypothetical protein